VLESLRGNDVFEFVGCLLVIPRTEPRLFLLNETARRIWQALDHGASIDQAVERLAAHYGVPLAQVRADVEAIVAEWRAQDLLTEECPRQSSDDEAAIGGGDRSPLARRLHAERIYRLCGQPIRVRFGSPVTEQLFHPAAAHTEAPESEAADVIDFVQDGPGFMVTCNGCDVERAERGEQALGIVHGRILELSYPDAEWLAVMHAGAVGDEHAAVVLAAESGSGKSTLTAALVHAGLRYLSDDIAPLDHSLRLRPMPIGIGLKQGSWSVLSSRYPQLASLPIQPGGLRRYLPVPEQRCAPPGGLPVKCLVFPRYCADDPTTLRPLSSIQKLERLTHARSWLSLDRRRFGVILDWLEETPGYELSHAALKDSVRVIKRLLSCERLDPSMFLD
jgi:Coenzyme PQQ synthesis protein D (PqqD)